MGMVWKEPSGSGDASGNSSEELSSSSSSAQQGGGVRRFPTAAQPEIMRAADKDDQYASFVYDAFRHLFGTRVAVAYQSELETSGLVKQNEGSACSDGNDVYSGLEDLDICAELCGGGSSMSGRQTTRLGADI
ncbi:hypothetical protein Vadar_026308 [Vaccinium darrowii]|uniref:Uncharacterized protein n=1 Tax=Vaccinium darrowii TaxID=229202 RepID=A0ACB7YPL1_9ERIC|nr:hypothetical protein Vadar_026308 [Vaccinium darrowii]